MGIGSSTEDHWHAQSVARILQNQRYTGIIKNGAATSDKIDSLQIIEDELFEKAQAQRQSYTDATAYTRRPYQGEQPAMLLLGLAYCGYCGKKLLRGTGVRKYTRKDGTVNQTQRQRYVCYTKRSHGDRCTGHTRYSVKLLEETVVESISETLLNMRSSPP